MKIKILGAAAGGGFPQWNCNYRLSRDARSGAPGVKRRTQSSLAASADGERWVLFNASPDIGAQLLATPALHPGPEGPLRATPIRAVVVTNADVDHIAGLLTLRERQPFNLYASAKVHAVLEANPIFRVLDPALVRRIELPLGRSTHIEGPDGPTGLTVETYAVAGKVALFLEDGGDPAKFVSHDGDTIGVALTNGGGTTAHYVPGCAAVDASLRHRIEGADCLLFDGTVFHDDEMEKAGVGHKTGRRMGHVPMSGPDGSIAALNGLRVGRRIFVHINNTNPVLDERSPERQHVVEAGWEVGEDGMEVVL